MGTAAGMMIEENLAIAARRGRRPTLRWSSSSKDASTSANSSQGSSSALRTASSQKSACSPAASAKR